MGIRAGILPEIFPKVPPGIAPEVPDCLPKILPEVFQGLLYRFFTEYPRFRFPGIQSGLSPDMTEENFLPRFFFYTFF